MIFRTLRGVHMACTPRMHSPRGACCCVRGVCPGGTPHGEKVRRRRLGVGSAVLWLEELYHFISHVRKDMKNPGDFQYFDEKWWRGMFHGTRRLAQTEVK